MDFDSPDVEEDFPGLYGSEGSDGRSKKSKEDSDYSDGGDHDKVSKKDLLIGGRRKDKKDKGKDRGYAALEGESSVEEEGDAKSPSKSKKSKTFKFSTSKSKEKREKSRDNKDKIDKDSKEEKEEKTPKPEKEKETKKKDKERKEKDKKDKTKDKDKKDKKLKQTNTVSEEVLELGDVQPVFGVSISLATERSRCHDGIDLPLVLRDCIDYLQEHALKCEQIYKVEPVKSRLQHYKRLYNNRERQPETDELDIPTACGLLKLFLRELPEPVLTTDLIKRFEEVASHPQIAQQQQELVELIEQLPSCNRTLLSWIMLHFDAVIQHEKHNKLNAQSLAMLLSPPLQMSHRLLVTLLTHTSHLFADVQLNKYVPPITSSSPKLPETPVDIQVELCKQESLLSQIHAEMNAGFVSKKREEQLWEVQRIITQLKRKLRSFEKRQEKSIEEPPAAAATAQPQPLSVDSTDSKQQQQQLQQQQLQQQQHLQQQQPPSKTTESDDESGRVNVTTVPMCSPPQPDATVINATTTSTIAYATQRPEEQRSPPVEIVNNLHADGLYVDDDTGLLMVPKTHSDFENLLRLQLENKELLIWKSQLQTRISAERAELLRLKQLVQHANANNSSIVAEAEETQIMDGDGDYEKIIENYMRENALLEHKKQMLAKEIFDERRECIAMQVELEMRQF